MRKFQRAAVVAVAVAGLSAFGAGVSFAGDGENAVPVSAVANSSATALAVGGGYYAQPQAEKKAGPEQHQAGPEQHQAAPEQHQAEPEQDYGQHGEGE
ncbi:hypothetical protein AB0O67_06765 [Streptomyces sp. NPDC086077]|uniref:hypothetical protein n=1 Tax=Streptomyces sp. NPDC086077 TaxID=3154862 RepID=UPI0034471566